MIVAATIAMILSAWEPSGPPPDEPPPGAPPSRHRALPPPTWMDSAITGRSRLPWSGRVVLDRPDGKKDTATACGGPSGSRIDFRDGRAMWESGDSMVLLDPATRTWKSRRGRGGPPPGVPRPVVYGHDTLLGRSVMVYTVRGPRGGAMRLWMDTTLPLLLRGEGPGPGARHMLQLQPGRGCPESSFSVPAGWTLQRRPSAPIPHEEPNLQAVEKAMGFAPPLPSWLPPGFEPAGQGWMEGHHRRLAHLRWSDGSRLVSVFASRGRRAFHDCEGDGPCHLGGWDPVVVRRHGDLSLLVTGPLPPAELRRIADGLR